MKDIISERIIRIGYPEYLDTANIRPYAEFVDSMQRFTRATLDLRWALSNLRALSEEE